MDPVVILHHALPEAGADAVPEWVHLVPVGEFRGGDGRGPYRVEDPAAVARISMQAGRLPIDENHATDLAAPRGEPAPARGWIVEMQAREDGVWGRVEWTAAGRALVADRAYRGISPAMAVSKTGGRVRSVLRASLTNVPNLSQLATLHHRQEPDVDLKKLRAALGLADDADEAAILTAAEAGRTAVTTHAEQLQRIAAAAGVEQPAEAGADAIVTALQARGGDDGAALRQTVTELQAEVTQLRGAQALARATEVVDSAIRDGKPIPKALRSHYIERHCKDPSGVETELAGLPSLHSGGLTARPSEAAGGADATEIALQARRYMAEQEKNGVSVNIAEAVAHVSRTKEKAA